MGILWVYMIQFSWKPEKYMDYDTTTDPWPFQVRVPELEVPTIYKAYVRPM